MIATRSLLHPNEPLPPYSPRQSSQTELDTASVHSQAPSYVSEVPSYHSGPWHSQVNQPTAVRSSTDNTTTSVPSANRIQSTMENQTHSRHSGITDARLCSNALQNDRSPNSSSPSQHSRQPPSTARDSNPYRTTRVPSLIPPDHPAPRHEEINSPPTAAPLLRPASLQAPPRRPSLPQEPPASSSPALSPLEDPLLVGSEAAAQARARRLYIASCTAENRRAFSDAETELMRKQEAKTWDFLLAQIGDWDGRERSWKGFKGERSSNGSRRG